MIDEIDAKILDLLQTDGRLTNAAIAEKVRLTTSTVYERVKKLEKKEIIQRYVAVVDPQKLGKPITAFIRLVIGTAPGEDYVACKQDFVTQCQAEPDVLECHSVAGEECYLLKIRVANTADLEKLLERLRSYTLVAKSTSNIVMSTFKEQIKISMEAATNESS
ncbi:Leucine-responsive regulatory protein, regulator for leucine (or lrp) regulon and high-affinity branched-chain amino acid transport system [hydrothermal vent metagenome]|uniref:Leucine-responsive regulatory protein, regulator for leucine (Or lrp) regulon and high-affinity branched-chain amino acid transport system n=1 Tax=hydrothermal vent metagenome TaxID=652676 RepID=A0A3B0USC0_9ZZZZ